LLFCLIISLFFRGQGHPTGNSAPYFGPSQKLDFELEMVSFLLTLVLGLSCGCNWPTYLIKLSSHFQLLFFSPLYGVKSLSVIVFLTLSVIIGIGLSNLGLV
jgi:hypothetical protein